MATAFSGNPKIDALVRAMQRRQSRRPAPPAGAPAGEQRTTFAYDPTVGSITPTTQKNLLSEYLSRTGATPSPEGLPQYTPEHGVPQIDELSRLLLLSGAGTREYNLNQEPAQGTPPAAAPEAGPSPQGAPAVGGSPYGGSVAPDLPTGAEFRGDAGWTLSGRSIRFDPQVGTWVWADSGLAISAPNALERRL